MNSIAKNILGSVEFEIIGGAGERFLNNCIQKGVPIQKVAPTDFGYKAQLPLRYYTRLHKPARKYKCRLKCTKKQGVYFLAWPFRHRWGVLAGFCVMLALLLVFPRMVYSVQFYDFTKEEELILREQLYNYEIAEGSMPTTDTLKNVQDRLFLESEHYSWIKLNFVAGKLVVEKISAVTPPEMEQTSPAAIVALCDGVIERIEVEGGFIEKNKGEYVKEGDVIISAVMVSSRDKLHTDRAQANIYAFVDKAYEASVPFNYETSVPSMNTQNSHSIYMFNKTFTLPFQAKVDDCEDCTILRKPATLLGLPLPATIVTTQCREQTTQNVTLSHEKAINIARSLIYEKLAQDLPECEVLEVHETVNDGEGFITLRMEFNTLANIAKVVEGWNL